jgi:26S proteasome non-ATPase regulatory subunit 9
MENLHAPTVPSGPTSGPANTNGIQTSSLTFPQLQAKKDNIEAELRALGSVLESVSDKAAVNTTILIGSSMASI